MKVLVCGSRDFKDYLRVRNELKPWNILHLVQGGARGADALAKQYALENNIPCDTYTPDWDKYGRSAGARRNLEMLETKPDMVVAFWDGQSRGTKHMIDIAEKAGVKTVVVNV